VRLSPAGRVLRVGLAATVICVAWSRPASAQFWPSHPLAYFEGKLLLAGEVSATCGGSDPGWFTYTSYDTSAVRRIRGDVTVEVRPLPQLAVLAELRAETGGGIQPYAAYLRITPFRDRAIDVQVGRIPPVFGSYARRAYPQDNPLIGDPLMYQYLTTLRSDAIPATADDVLRQRARGWLVRYPIGNTQADNGLPVIAVSRYASGVEARAGSSSVEVAVAVTSGTPTEPRPADGSGVQVAGHVAWRPSPVVTLGASASHGTFIESSVRTARPGLPAGHDAQDAVGADGEVSWGRWLVRGEFISSAWELPPVSAPIIGGSLSSRAGYLEAKIRLRPGIYAAARADRLWFSQLSGSSGANTWDADVTRVEAGAGWTFHRGFLLKASVMAHWRDGGRITREQLGALQIVAWF